MGGKQSRIECQKCYRNHAVYHLRVCSYVNSCICNERICNCRFQELKKQKIDEITGNHSEILEFVRVPIFNNPRIGKIVVEAYACKFCVKDKYMFFDEYEENGFKNFL